jgi:hypothetical protein
MEEKYKKGRDRNVKHVRSEASKAGGITSFSWQ